MANAVRINKTQRRKINVFVRCVGISLLAWLLFSISNQYTVSVKAAIEYVNLPEKRAFHPQQSDTVKVKLEMTGWQFLFSKAALETPKVQVDLSSLKTKDWIVFSNQLGFINRQFPHEQRVVSVSPDTLFFDFSKQTQRKVPVKPLSNIGFKRGYGFIADTKITPAYVTITGPYEDVSAIEYWETDTVRGKEVETDVRTVANLARNQKANINVYPTSVEVLMPVGELTEKVIELPVKVENGQRYSSVRLNPSKVVVTVLMSVKDYNNYTSRDFEAVVDLADWEKNGVQYLPVLLTKVPDFCKVISVVPQNVDFLYVNNTIFMKIGITGGIGSGKTFICQLFKAMAVPVYNADDEAKELMNTDLRIKERLIAEFGKETYKDGKLDRAFLAEQIFSDKAKLELVNGIVHPIVIQAAKDWAEQQKSRYSLKEAALLFESGSYKDLDYTILVTAPLHIRVKRVMERDGVTEEQVMERINKQLTDEEKLKLADFVIINDGTTPLLPQVWTLHQKFLK